MNTKSALEESHHSYHEEEEKKSFVEDNDKKDIEDNKSSELEEKEKLLRKSEEKKFFWKEIKDKITNIFPDFLSYHTKKELNVLDRRLGYTYMIAFILIFFYIVIYIFMIEKLYLGIEKVYGNSELNIIGKSHSTIDDKTFIWDESFVRSLESNLDSIFIPTKVTITKNQKKRKCPSSFFPCSNDSDCNNLKFYQSDGKCDENSNSCIVDQWCSENSPETAGNTISHSLIGVSHLRVKISSEVKFENLDKKTFHSPINNKLIEYPSAGANVFTISDILSMAGESFTEIKETGCILQINLIWNCDLFSNDDCKPKYEVIRLDSRSNKGIILKKTSSNPDLNTRDEYSYTGIKIFSESVGIGERPFFYNIIVQLYTALALIGGAKALTDFLMLHLFKEKNHYTMMKYIETKDMNP